MLEWATDYFKKKDIPDPRHSIEWLLAETLDIKRLDLYLCFDRPLSPSELDELRPLVKRRATHEPLQYITGFSEFMNAHINVAPGVLIPRIETEQLVEIILSDHPTDQKLNVLDIGTGSGCIPIALKMERPNWAVSAFDISEAALHIARENAAANDVTITFAQGDVSNTKDRPFAGQFDLIVSNPPYVIPDEKQALQPQVKNHEPEEALFCDDIEKMYGDIISYADEKLASQGILYLEINEKHGDLISSLFPSQKWGVEIKRDYQDKQRFIVARRR